MRSRCTGRVLVAWLFVLAIVGASSTAFSQTDADPALQAEIRNTRARLEGQQPKVPAAELDQLAEFLGRSNYLARVIVEALQRNEITNAMMLLGRFPGKVNDLNWYGEPLVVNAANYNRAELLEALLKLGADPNQRKPNGNSALHIAIERRNWPMATSLVKAQADVTLTNQSGQTPLGMFMSQWYSGQDDGVRGELLQLLLDRGADCFAPIRARDPTSILEDCLTKRNDSVPDLLLTNLPSVGRRTPGGDTALHIAALWWRTNALDFLLAARFSVNQTNTDGLTPLQTVAAARMAGAPMTVMRGGQIASQAPAFRLPTGGVPGFSMSDFLLARGARLDIFSAAGLGLTNELAEMLRTDPASANARDGLGRAPLHYAVFAEQAASVLSLLNADAETSVPTLKPARLPRIGALPSGSTPLHLAVRNASGTSLRALLFKSANVHAADEEGNTPLHLSALGWDTNVTALLLRAGSPLNVTNRTGRTPLRMAVETGFAGNVQLLLTAGARTDVGLDDTTLVHLAAERGRADVIAVLVKHGLPSDARDAEGRTPFFQAFQRRQWAAIKDLYARRANVNAADTNGNTVLHQLMAQMDDRVGHQIDLRFWERWQQHWLNRPGMVRDALQKLIKANILPRPPVNTWTNTSLTTWLIGHGANVNLTNRAGQTPLHVLCSQNWIGWSGNPVTNRIAWLLRAGARMDMSDAKGATPLHLAARQCSPEVLALLRERAGKALNTCDGSGRTVLDYATQNERYSITNLSMLLGRGTDPNLPDADGCTPLQRAITNRDWSSKCPAIVKTLLEHEARHDLADSRGRTPLHWLAGADTPHILTNVSLLLAHGANPNARNKDGSTPLHLAVTNRIIPRAQLVQLLLANKANPDANDAGGQTPLYLLVTTKSDYFHGAGDVLRYLLDAGANPERIDTNGQTLLHLAASQPHLSGNGLFLHALARNPALLNLTNATGDTPLHVAIRTDNLQNVMFLRTRGADVMRKNNRGETAVYLAAQRHKSPMGSMICPAGTYMSFWNALSFRDFKQFELWLAVDPHLASIRFDNGETPMSIASKDRRMTNFVQRLLRSGVPLDPFAAMQLGRTNELRQLLQQQKILPAVLLFKAIEAGQFESIQDFAEARGDLHAINDQGHSLLHDALDSGQINVADWLRVHGVRLTFLDAVNLSDTNYLATALSTNRALANYSREDWPILMYAARMNRPASARVLLAHGAEVNGRGKEGWTALHVAALWRAEEVAMVLLDAGAELDARDGHGFTPLHLSARSGNTSVVKLLLERGAMVNVRATNQSDDRNVTMSSGSTPLHWAAQCGRLDVTRLLLQHGADAKIMNAAGERPVDLAGTGESIPHYHYLPASFREPPPGDPVRSKIHDLLTKANDAKEPPADAK